MPRQPANVKDLDQAREYFRERGFYAGNRNLFSDRDLYVGLLHEGEDFDRVEDAFYLYMEGGAWVTRVTPEGGDPVISHYESFEQVWQARYPGYDSQQVAAPAPEPQVLESRPDEAELSQDDAVPEGFEPLFRSSPFLDLLGPVYNRRSDRTLLIGFFAAEKHCNARGVVHGGVISSLADVALGYSAVVSQEDPKPLVTANLSVDYAGAAKLGDWIEIETDVQKVGGKMAFANCYVRVGSKRIARASAVFSVVDK